jgi:carboxypeptidase C (cathepsin A)
MFYAMFTPVNLTSTSVVIVWLEGGPGVTGWYPILDQMGPFAYNSTATSNDSILNINKYMWNKDHYTVFID